MQVSDLNPTDKWVAANVFSPDYKTTYFLRLDVPVSNRQGSYTINVPVNSLVPGSYIEVISTRMA